MEVPDRLEGDHPTNRSPRVTDLPDHVRDELDFLLHQHGPGWLPGHASRWRQWEAWCDLHGLDPDDPADADMAALVMARAVVGASWQSIDSVLATLARGCHAAPGIVVPARRLLSDLYDDGWFDPSWQAPVLTLGEVLAMIAKAPDPESRFVVALTYLAGLRPGEWKWLRREDVFVTRDGRVQMMLPVTKAGKPQRVEVEPIEATGLNLPVIVEEFLTWRGDAPGPLLTRRARGLLRRCAAAAGVAVFSPYSLRRSMATHANLLNIPGPVIATRLRHARGSQTWRRYIEPLLAILDQKALRDRYLNTDPPTGGAVPLTQVRSGRPSPVRAYTFAAGGIDALLAEVTMTDLRVPSELAMIRKIRKEKSQGYHPSPVIVPPSIQLPTVTDLPDHALGWAGLPYS